ncbi:MAG TPA: cation:proton antiporter [Steroidobacteraceae bacterium]|nr:cation:proton antiporter [Steroidobacteraceae bacterium]
MSHSPLVQVLVLLAAAVLVVYAVRRLKLSPILGYLAVGMVLGPHALGLAADNTATSVLAEIGVVFLVFTLGLEFSLPRLVAMRWEVLGLGGGQVLITAGIGAVIAWRLGVELPVAIVLGGAIAMSSTAIIVRQLSEQAEVNRTHGRLAVAILLFQDIAFVPFLALTSARVTHGELGDAGEFLRTVTEGGIALLIVLAAGRWLLRPLFHEIAHARSPELFVLAVLLVVLGSAWTTQIVGLSLALGAFLAGVMLAETEFRHQVEAVIRPFRDVLLGLFFITIGMLFDTGLLVRQLLLVTGLVMVLVVGKTLIVTLLAQRFARSFFKALRTGIVVSIGGEFGFALLTILLRDRLVAPDIVQPLLAAIVVSMVASPLLIRHNKQIARWILREAGPEPTALAREEASTRALAQREHVLLCGFGRVGQNIARVLEDLGFEYIAVDNNPARVRAARQAGDPVVYGDAGQEEVLENVGLDRASVVVISFADSMLALRIIAAVRAQRPGVPILVRTQDDTRLLELQKAGASTVVPETFEAALMLVWHVLLLLQVPVSRVMKTIGDIRGNRYNMMRTLFRRDDTQLPDASEALREQLYTLVLPPGAWAVGRSIDQVKERAEITVSAIRREGIVGREPSSDTVLKEGDVLVLYGTPEALEHGEAVLLMG